MHFYGKCVLRCLLCLHYFLRHLVRLVFPLHSFSYGLYNIHITAVKDVKNELPCVINTKINLLQDEYASLWKVMPAEKVFLSLKGFSRRSKLCINEPNNYFFFHFHGNETALPAITSIHSYKFQT